jgi:hypothetical protein
MNRIICTGFFLILLVQNSFSQKNQIRSLNEVVFSFYKPWNEEQKKQKIAAPLLHDDIDLFVKTIEEIGVNPYLNFPRDSFYLEIDLLKKGINKPLTRHEFLQLFVPISNDLKLSHTYVNSEIWFDKNTFDSNDGTYLPMSVTIDKNRLFVDKDYSPLNLTEGDEIIAINSIPSGKIIDSLIRYPNSTTLISKLMDVQNNFPLWFWWVYGYTDTFRIETNKGTYSIKGLTSVELDKLKKENLTQQTEKEYKQYEYKRIDFKTSELIFKDFGIRDTIAYNHFLDSAFLQIKSNQIHSLIIDVRANQGGNNKYIEVIKYLYDKPFKTDSLVYFKKSKTAQDFFLLFLYPKDKNNFILQKYINESCFGSCEAEHNYGEVYTCGDNYIIPKPDSIRYKGNLYVFSDYNTKSAGVNFVTLIKDYKIGTIIGTDTNQSPSNDANGCYFVLPNSNVMAIGATMYEIRPNGDPSSTRGVVPDYEVTQSENDTKKGIDTVMGFTMKLIKNKN